MKIKVSLQGITIPFLCFVLFSSAASGQEETEQAAKTLKYGIKMGTTLSSFSSEQPHNNYKPGFTAGVFINYPLSSDFSLQLEPAYFQQGGNLIAIYDYAMFLIPDPPFLLEVKDQKVTYHNIDVPLLLKYEKQAGGIKFFCDAGPSFGFNLRSGIITHVSARSFGEPGDMPVYYDFREEENISSNIKTLQYGITGGLGFEAPIGSHSLIFDIKYRYGLNRTWPGYSYLGIAPIQGDLQSNTLYFTLGFGF